MAIAIRKKDGKFYAPQRDVNNWFVPACRATIRLASEAFNDNEQALQRVKECAVCLAETYNEALLASPENVSQVLHKMAERLQQYPAEFSTISRIFLVIVAGRFIAGVRETPDTADLSEQELASAMAVAGLLPTLPDDLAAQVEKALRLYGQWPAPLFDLPALFAVQEEGA